MRGATWQRQVYTRGHRLISIHAPRAGCDATNATEYQPYNAFQSTHPVRGATTIPTASLSLLPLFQSTHPVRGATGRARARARVAQISIHAPRAGCDIIRRTTLGFSRLISIHAPRAGCDVWTHRTPPMWTFDFNPRTPCGGRRIGSFKRAPLGDISIHAPRAGCDTSMSQTLRTFQKFQSTHPVRGATIFNFPA